MKLVQIKNTIYILLIILCTSACLKNDELNRKFESYEPIDIADGHTISNPSAVQMDPVALKTIYADVYKDEDLWSLRSLLVFRHGKLVAESYLKDETDITNRHLVWSCTKQVMGILTGIAIESGFINNIEDPISKYFDQELQNHADKSTITIRNLITMRSGIDYDNDGADGETDKLLRQIPDNSVEFILDRPLNAIQGSTFHYNDGNPHLMSALIQKKVGKPTDVWADEVLFSRIEMNNYNWVRYRDGITLGGFGIETSPRELAKIALCVADTGKWKGQQVVPSNWMHEMTSTQITIEDADYTFGFYWWIDPIRNIHFMWGHGGQFAFVVPEKDIVIIMTAIPNTQGDYQISDDAAFEVVDRIVAASF